MLIPGMAALLAAGVRPDWAAVRLAACQRVLAVRGWLEEQAPRAGGA